MVGESGPEELTLPKGASVKPLRRGDQRSPTTVVLQLNDREFARAVVNVLDEKMNLRTI